MITSRWNLELAVAEGHRSEGLGLEKLCCNKIRIKSVVTPYFWQ
jgi:hypothetical protein